MKAGPPDSEPLHLVVGDLDAGRVFVLVDFGTDHEAGLRGRRGNRPAHTVAPGAE